MVRSKKSVKKTGFSLVEAVISLSLLGLILLMIAPVIGGRTTKTASVHCAYGGTKVFTNDGELKLEKGVSKLYITAVRGGEAGYPYQNGENGSIAGNSYKTWYPTEIVNLARTDTKGVVVSFSNGIPIVALKDSDGNTKVVLNERISPNRPKSYNPDYRTFKPILNGKVSNEAPLSSGTQNFGNFRGPIFGSGGRGTFEDANNVTSVDYPNGAVVLEWNTNCVIQE